MWAKKVDIKKYLKEFDDEASPVKQTMTDEAMEAQARALNALFGGVEEEVE